MLAVAKEYGKEISEEEAKKTLEEIDKFRASGKASGELSDDDLDNVAGGSDSYGSGLYEFSIMMSKYFWHITLPEGM